MRAKTLGRREPRLSGRNPGPPPMRALTPEIGEEEEVDRLSHLPDDILHQILSFLDTKFAVQTSLLSTRFRSLCKHAPRLNFNRDSFRSAFHFRRFVNQVLDARRNGSRIVKFSYKDSASGLNDSLDDLARFLRNGESPHHTLKIRTGSRFRFLSFSVGYFPDCDLELARVCLYNAVSWAGFSRLASLKLEECYLYVNGRCPGLESDFFAKFLCLKDLVLLDCNFIHPGECFKFKISGPHLVSLQIHGMNLGGATVEIVAPKLKSFSFVFCLDVPKFSRFSLPSLDHANLGIKFKPYFFEKEKGIVTANFVNLFHALHNAASLRFDYHIIEAVSKICDGLEHQPCPFTRLNCLKVPRSWEPKTIPDQLITYFLKGSSRTNPGFLQFV